MAEINTLHQIRLPDKPRHVHLMGICGTGMAALAGMFHEKGLKVTGSDQTMYPPMSDFLKSLKIKVMEGYSAENLNPSPDLVVVGNVIRRTNPEAQILEHAGIPYTSMPGALEKYFLDGKKSIVVTGTHGKTTVSAMIAWILNENGIDAGFMIGGLPLNFNKNYKLGRSDFFVIEGDEYDTAYFDKTPKFLHYKPNITVVTSCEFDHGDIYRDLNQIRDQFKSLVSLVPPEGSVIANADGLGISSILNHCSCSVETYGSCRDANWYPEVHENGCNGIKADIARNGKKVASGNLPVIGYHNLMNVVAAIAVARNVGVEPKKAMEALSRFKGVKRRQEVIGEVAGITVIDDFAHHPTAVAATCSGIRARFPDRRFVAVFEPRTNTSKRAFFQDLYISAFLDPDLIVLREPRDVDHIPEFDRFSSKKLASDLQAIGKCAEAFNDTDELLEFLLKELIQEDLVLIMSNGNFDNLGSRLLNKLKERKK